MRSLSQPGAPDLLQGLYSEISDICELPCQNNSCKHLEPLMVCQPHGMMCIE